MKKQIKLMVGDNMLSLAKLPDNSIDSVVTDGPYGLSFMNKRWDYEVPSVDFWKEVYRVLKPGGHVLSFGGTRTYHRMVVNIEDAGFEIRDQIQWLYGSGFPKSHNIGKAVDKIQGNEREVVGKSKPRGSSIHGGGQNVGVPDINTKGTTPQEGWGTALKPAVEPICVARKPLSESTIAANVLKWGTGGINIDGCRIGSDTIKVNGGGRTHYDGRDNPGWNNPSETENEGRFPANIIFDESAAEMLDEQSGISKTNCKKGTDINSEVKGGSAFPTSGYKKATIQSTISDQGGASRFFYIAKVSKSERNMGLDGFEDKIKTSLQVNMADGIIPDTHNRFSSVTKNTHPTLKPVQLMAYLCRLVTPVGGIVLDPFMGSGSTGISACLEGFRFVGMEMNEEYFTIASARIEAYEKYRPFVEKKKKKK